MYLTVQFFIEINNILTASKSIALRKVNESYMDLIKVYEQRLNRRSPAKFYSIILKKYINFMMETVERLRYCLPMMI